MLALELREASRISSERSRYKTELRERFLSGARVTCSGFWVKALENRVHGIPGARPRLGSLQDHHALEGFNWLRNLSNLEFQ
jgi:hypothetical protein